MLSSVGLVSENSWSQWEHKAIPSVKRRLKDAVWSLTERNSKWQRRGRIFVLYVLTEWPILYQLKVFREPNFRLNAVDSAACAILYVTGNQTLLNICSHTHTASQRKHHPSLVSFIRLVMSCSFCWTGRSTLVSCKFNLPDT